ncbi:MAG TPA: LysM peptidoglycan-binding domain-containing protein [Bryobacteraceae bacterium]|jgi:nucleoid-associated protein YgaU|nr:LysM peptidoglycan-binding domain-containing protein [Bryobacteraceae bacterium]
MADQLEQMKQKYSSVLSTIEQQIQLSHVHIQDNKLFIQGVAPSEQAKNKVWDQIKQVNANWAQELTADISVDPNAKSTVAGAGALGGQQRTYTVQPGDSLSKISKEVYGKPSEYMKIFEANRDVLNDPNKISPGQTLKIPA